MFRILQAIDNVKCGDLISTETTSEEREFLLGELSLSVELEHQPWSYLL